MVYLIIGLKIELKKYLKKVFLSSENFRILSNEIAFNNNIIIY